MVRSTTPDRGGALDLATLKKLWMVVIAGGFVLPFLDAPLRTWGQKFVVERSRARLILVSLELDLVALWVVAKWVFRWEIGIVPPAGALPLALAGLLLTILGASFSAWAKVRLGRWFSATFGVKEGHVLVTDGPYAITRHPIYTGIVTALIGSALVWNSTLTLILAVLMVVPFFLHTVYEESLFEHHFGEPYFEYQRRVPRLVPFARRG